MAQIERGYLAKRDQRNQPDPVPITLLGQLAVDDGVRDLYRRWGFQDLPGDPKRAKRSDVLDEPLVTMRQTNTNMLLFIQAAKPIVSKVRWSSSRSAR